MSKKKTQHWWNSSTNILLFTALGIVAGFLTPNFIEPLKPIGDIFINLIRMLVIPIVFFAVVNSTMLLRQSGQSSKIGLKAPILFLTLSSIAAFLAVVVAVTTQPGSGMAAIPQEFLNGTELYQSKVPKNEGGILGFILNIIPSNPFQALYDGNMLQIILLSVFLGIGLASYKGESIKGLHTAITTLSEVLSWMMSKIMLMVPIAAFSLMSYAVAHLGSAVLLQLLKYFSIFALLTLFWDYVVIGLAIKFKTGIPYFDFVKKTVHLQIYSLTTSSSLVSLPINIKTAKDLLGKKEDKTIDFVLPIGTTLNLTGTAMHYTFAAIFFAQVFHIDLHMMDYIAMAFTAVIGASAAAGVPGTSLLIASVFVAGGVPLSGLPLLFAADRLFDMVNTTSNVLGNTCAGILLTNNKNK